MEQTGVIPRETGGSLTKRALKMTYLGFETWVGGFWGMSKTAEVHSGFGAFRKQGQFYYWLYQQLSIEANSRRAGATIDKVATITHIRLGRGMLEIL